MDKRDEIVNRWMRVFEQKTPEAKKMVLDRIKDFVTDDIYYLLKELKQKEDDLAASLSGVSSKFGPVVISENGILKYRINGEFVDIAIIANGLRELVVLCNIENLEHRVKNCVELDKLREVFKDAYKK